MQEKSKIKHLLDVHLGEVFRQFITIQDADLKHAQKVFKDIFEQVKLAMDDQCNYFKKYSSQVLFAGSVYDGTKVSKMNEIDMNIVIKLPVCYDNIVIENDQPGFVSMKICDLDHLDNQPNWENCHKVLRDWRDSEKYLLQVKIRSWLHGIVAKAINQLKGKVEVSGITYLVSFIESGPAYTLAIRNKAGNEEFQLDVDLVPVIRFMHPRRPKDYKVVKDVHVRNWFVVPKPNKAILNNARKNRCWRLSFQDHEREMMKASHALKTTIRLVKKLRDGLELKYIASYYIKTLFLWEIAESDDKSFWCNRLSVTFRRMIQELYDAVKNKNIPYFWHKDYNLLEGVKPSLLRFYESKLLEVLDAIDANDCKKVVSFMLTTKEMKRLESNFYTNLPVKLQGLYITPERASNADQESFSRTYLHVTNLTERLLDIRQRVSTYHIAFKNEVKAIRDNLFSLERELLKRTPDTITKLQKEESDLGARIVNLKTYIDTGNSAIINDWISLKDEIYNDEDILHKCFNNIFKELLYERLCIMEDELTKLMNVHNQMHEVNRLYLFNIAEKYAIIILSGLPERVGDKPEQQEIYQRQRISKGTLRSKAESCSRYHITVPSCLMIALVSLAIVFLAVSLHK